MATVVMVHGAGNALWGPTSIKAKWYPALADGLAWHGESCPEDDVAVAFYGDLYRPDPERGYEPPVEGARAMAAVSKLVEGLDLHIDLDELTKVLTEQHLDHMLAQAAAYLQDPAIRAAARARVEAAVGPDTKVVVAHSLGTVVAYETLCLHPEWPVTDFVTLGSPLGGPVVFGRLEPGPQSGTGHWPGSLAAWTNVQGSADPACLGTLAGRFGGPVRDHAVDNGHRVHDPEPYLNNPTTGRAVAVGLRRTAPEPEGGLRRTAPEPEGGLRRTAPEPEGGQRRTAPDG